MTPRSWNQTTASRKTSTADQSRWTSHLVASHSGESFSPSTQRYPIRTTLPSDAGSSLTSRNKVVFRPPLSLYPLPSNSRTRSRDVKQRTSLRQGEFARHPQRHCRRRWRPDFRFRHRRHLRSQRCAQKTVPPRRRGLGATVAIATVGTIIGALIGAALQTASAAASCCSSSASCTYSAPSERPWRPATWCS